MADTGAEEMYERDKFDISQLILLQSAVRGVLVRKWMKEVKQAFEATFTELEKNPELSVEWKTELPCRPKIVRTRDKLKKVKKDKPTKSCSEKTKHLQNTENFLQNVIQDNQTDFKGTKITPVYDLRPVEHVSSEGESETFSEISDALRESPRFNSVEIQTSFIDVNYQHVPEHIEHDCNNEEDEGNNVLDDLDTSWKDRVEPFIRNNFGDAKAEVANDNKVTNELHLDLETDEESVKSQRSSENTKRSYKDSAREKNSVNNEQESNRNEELRDERNREIESQERISKTSDRTEKSQSSSRKRFDGKEESSYRGQRLSHSEDRSRLNRNNTDDLSARSNTESDRLTNRSSRSNRSHDRGHKLNETEGFSPRSQRSNSYKSEIRSGHLSDRSDISDKRRKNAHKSQDAESQRSDGSKSQRSEDAKSHRSNDTKSFRSDDAQFYRSVEPKSHRSNSLEGRQSSKSDRSNRSSDDKGQRSDRSAFELPLESRASPVPSKLSGREPLQGANSREGRPPLQDSTTLTNVTSVWDSFNSMRDSHDVEMPKALPQDPVQLKELRKNIAMELLWVQQAIDSRKNYLKLKGQM